MNTELHSHSRLLATRNSTRKGVARERKNGEGKNLDAETTTVSIFHNIVDMIFFYSKLKNPIKNSVLCASVFLLDIISF